MEKKRKGTEQRRTAMQRKRKEERIFALNGNGIERSGLDVKRDEQKIQ